MDSTPILVPLTALQARGYHLAGTAPDDNVYAQIETILLTGAMDAGSAAFMAEKLSEAALEARAVIEAATAFEIVIEEAPSPMVEEKPTKKASKSSKSKVEK